MEIAFVPPLTLLRSASWEALELDEPEPERIDELLLETTWVSGEERLRWRTTGWLAAPCCCWEPEAALRLCEIAGRSPLLARIGWSVEGARCGELLLGRLRLAGWPREMAAHLTLLGAGADGRACSLETVWLPALLAEDLEALAHGTSFELLCRRDPLGALRVRISLTVLAAGTRSSSATLPARSGELAERLQHQPLEWDEEESQTPLRRPTFEKICEVSAGGEEEQHGDGEGEEEEEAPTPPPQSAAGCAADALPEEEETWLLEQPALGNGAEELPTAAEELPTAAEEAAASAVVEQGSGPEVTAPSAGEGPAAAMLVLQVVAPLPPAAAPLLLAGSPAPLSQLPAEGEAWLSESTPPLPEDAERPAAAAGNPPGLPAAAPAGVAVPAGNDSLAFELQQLLVPIAGPAAELAPQPAAAAAPGDEELQEVEEELDRLLTPGDVLGRLLGGTI